MMIPLKRGFTRERVVQQTALVADKIAVLDVIPPESNLAGSIGCLCGFVCCIQFLEALLDTAG